MSNTEVVGLNQTQQGSIENIPVHLKQRISILQPEGPLFFGIADTLYRQVDRLVHYDVLIISLDRVPLVDLSGALSLEDLILLAQKRNTKVILKGLKSNVRRVLTELGILKKIDRENVVDDFEAALTLATNFIAPRHRRNCDFENQSGTPVVLPPQSK